MGRVGELIPFKRIYRGGTRRYAAIHPLYDMAEKDWRFFLANPAARVHHRPISVEERHECREGGRAEFDHIVVVQVVVDAKKDIVGLVRLGWHSPFAPTYEELEVFEFEPGVQLREVLAGARATILKRSKRKWK